MTSTRDLHGLRPPTIRRAETAPPAARTSSSSEYAGKGVDQDAPATVGTHKRVTDGQPNAPDLPIVLANTPAVVNSGGEKPVSLLLPDTRENVNTQPTANTAPSAPAFVWPVGAQNAGGFGPQLAFSETPLGKIMRGKITPRPAHGP